MAGLLGRPQNKVLVVEKASLSQQNAVRQAGSRSSGTSPAAARLAERAVAGRGVVLDDEVRRLVDAGREAMARAGTRARPRVADIVAAAGLSNDAFYRHFRSKDDLVAAILEDGTERLASYLAHQMGKEVDAASQVRRWVEGVLAQAVDEDAAATTLAVLWNGGSVGEVSTTGRPSASAPLARLLLEPLAALGSPRPDLDAALVGHAVVGRLSDHLWGRTRPEPDEVADVAAACLAVARRGAGSLSP
jgi:AcrR family transcriptional regulator